MNQCASEWFFDKFLQVPEETEASTSRGPDRDPNQCRITNPGASSSVMDSNLFGSRSDLVEVGDDEAPAPQPCNPQLLTDPGNYQAVQKKNLDMFYATVAMSRVHPVSPTYIYIIFIVMESLLFLSTCNVT